MDDSDDQALPTMASDGLNYQRFRLISSLEREAMLKYMLDQSGLNSEQIAVNSWGFPAIPIPEPRRFSGKVRLAPRNININFLGHPIYWIEPELTERWEGESDDSWCIRMYYTILLAGYWEDGVGWINFLAANGFKHSPADIDGYHMLSNPDISIDKPDVKEKFALIGESDIQGGLDAVAENHKAAIARCNVSWKQELGEFIRMQTVAMAHARNILGGDDNIINVDATPDDPSGPWASDIEPALYAVSDKYNLELSKEAPIMSGILEEAEKVFGGIQEMLSAYSNITATISVPVVRSGSTASESYSQMLSYMGLAASQAARRTEGIDIVNMARKCFSEDRNIGALDSVIREVHSIYSIAWRRMRMATVNHGRVFGGEQPFSTYQELEISLIGSEDSNVDQHEPVDDVNMAGYRTPANSSNDQSFGQSGLDSESDIDFGDVLDDVPRRRPDGWAHRRLQDLEDKLDLGGF